MLAAAADSGRGLPDDGTTWAYEVKWDGLRALADLAGGCVRLSSGTGADITAAFPELAELGAQHPGVLLDGEVVVLRDGLPSHAALADRMRVSDPRPDRALVRTAPATFVVFDVLRLYGVELIARSWQERRNVLERLGVSGRAWQLSPVYDERDVLVAATLQQGLAGVVAKRRASRYVPGARTGDWLTLTHRSSAHGSGSGSGPRVPVRRGRVAPGRGAGSRTATESAARRSDGSP